MTVFDPESTSTCAPANAEPDPSGGMTSPTGKLATTVLAPRAVYAKAEPGGPVLLLSSRSTTLAV